MFRYTSFLSLMVAGMVITQVDAAPKISALVQVLSLSSRQTTSTIPDVPAQCESECDPVNAGIASGCAATTCCQPSFEMGYFNCFECAGQAVNLTDYTTPQQILDELIDACAAHGFALPKLTFPGQNPNRTVSSVVGGTPTSAAANSSQSTVVSQTTIFSVTPSPPIAQSTVTAPPSTTNAPSQSPTPSTASGSKSVENSRLGLGIATLLVGVCFYLGL